MNDSVVISAQGPSRLPARREWLLFIHQIPPKPDYFRVKVRRRLQRIGALPLKNSVYLLPAGEDTMEDFQWLLREVRAEGGEANLCRAAFVETATDRELEAAFRAERESEYAEIERAASTLSSDGSDEAEVERLRRRMEEAEARDRFGAEGREAARRALNRAAAVPADTPSAEETSGIRGRTWVTRPGPRVDRMASAWLIRRFIDSEARFEFAPAGAPAASGKLRFDMFDGEYTHEGDRCTFEVLLDRFGLTDPALRAVAEVVHDIDCKDEKFGRPETSGIAAVVNGITLTVADDLERLARGATLFEGLYRQFGGG